VTHEKVRALQHALNAFTKKYLRYVPALAVDGKKGHATNERIKLDKYYLGYVKKRRTARAGHEFRVRLRHPRSTKHANRKAVMRGIRRRRRQRRTASKAGKVVVLPGANRPGVSISAITMAFLEAVASQLGGTLTVSTGTNHNRLTTSGSVSDHYDGHAGDEGISWNDGNKVAAAALRVCGYNRVSAWWLAFRGGLHNTSWRGHRVQVIWKTYIGGNHYNHVHLGCR
jgi:hypothetical protein